jgi:hypothetical protein
MSDRPSHQSPGTTGKFVPSVIPLESRLLLSRQVLFPDGSQVLFPLINKLPRTGGVAIQSGTALTIGVGQPTTNKAVVQGVGGANTSAEWNGRAAHSFTGVDAALLQIGGARRDQVTFQLTNLRTGPTAIATGLLAATPAVSAKSLAQPVHTLGLKSRTSGTAVQSGSLLTITVTALKINNVEISSLNSGQDVQAVWNGGAVHDFSGVSTIIVDLKNGRKDLVGLDTTSRELYVTAVDRGAPTFSSHIA